MFEDVPDEQLRAECRELEAEIATLRSTKRRYREDAHETLDLSVKAAKGLVDTLLREGVYRLSRSTGSAIGIPGLADAIALTDPGIVKRFHKAIDAEPGSNSPGATFGPLTRAEYQAKHDALRAELDGRTRELARRIEARRHEAELDRISDVPARNVGRAPVARTRRPGLRRPCPHPQRSRR